MLSICLPKQRVLCFLKLSLCTLLFSSCNLEGIQAVFCEQPPQSEAVSTLPWKPEWEWNWNDVTLAPNGDFYFSPQIQSNQLETSPVRADVLVRVNSKGELSQIRTGPVAKAPEAIPQLNHVSSEESFVPLSPGQILAGKKGIWVFNVGLVHSLRLLQAYAPIPWETNVFSNEGKDQVLKLTRLFTNSQDKLFGIIYEINYSKKEVEEYKIVHIENSEIKVVYDFLKNTPQRPPIYGTFSAGSGSIFIGTGVFFEQYSPPYVGAEHANQVFRLKNDVLESWVGQANTGFQDGFREKALFENTGNLVAAKDNTLYISDTNNHAIRKVSPEGEVTTLTGNGTADHVDGDLASARFKRPGRIFLGPCHQLFVFDDNGIRRIQLPPGPSAERP